MNRFLILFFLAFQVSFSQGKYKVTGVVLEKGSSYPLEYATVSLEDISTSKVVSGVITDSKGHFSLKAEPGTYLLKVQYFSFKTYQINKFVFDKDKDLGTIFLEQDIEELEAIEVTGKRTTVEMKLDKKVYNVGDDMSVKGGAITDVLDNVPSVSVDNDGKVSLRGSENVTILINGKPSELVGMGSDTLKQLPSEMIEKIEVVTNPSSRYDAEGTSGIINIVLKQNSDLGLTGSVGANVVLTESDNYGGNLNLNLRKGKFNFFSNTSLRYNKMRGEHVFNQESFNYDGSISNYQDEIRQNTRKGNGLNANFGVEYTPFKNTSITNSFVYGGRDNKGWVDANIFNYNSSHALVYNRLRSSYEKGRNDRYQYSFNFTQKFDDKGQNLSVDYQYSKRDNDSDSFVSDILKDEKVSDSSNNFHHLIKSDYVLPLGKDSQFEAGYQGSFKNQDTTYDVFDETPSGSGNFLRSVQYSNRFVYGENINSLYSQYGTKFGRFNTMLGLRAEHTKIDVEQETEGKSTKSYFGLFPSLYLGYSFSEKSQLSVGYSRRLQRPRGGIINPFTSRRGNTNLFRGNADINPMYTNSFDAGYLVRFDKVTLNTSVYHHHLTDVFQFVAFESGEFVNVGGENVPVMINTPINLSTQNKFGLEFTTNYTPISNLRLTWNFNFFNVKNRGDFSYKNYLGNTVSTNFDSESTSWFTRLSAKSTIFWDIDLQSTAMYMAPSKTAQSKTKGIGFVNLSLSKEVLKKKGTIVLNVSDLFDSRRMVSDTYTSRVHTYTKMQWRPRTVTLNFTYRFGKSDKKSSKPRKSNMSEEDDSSNIMEQI